MSAGREVTRSDLIWLSEAQMGRIEPYCPLSRGVPRVHDRRIVSDIIFVVHNGLRWHSAPAGYGPHKTIYSCSIRWSGPACSTESSRRWQPRATNLERKSTRLNAIH